MGAISITISPGGTKTAITVINIREDLRGDFEYFKEQALNAPSDEGGFVKKRYLRAALVSLFAYMEAVVSVWLHDLLVSAGRQYTPKHEWMSLQEKSQLLTRLSKARLKNPRVNKAKDLRNMIVHFGVGKESQIFHKLDDALLSDTQRALDSWLDDMSVLLGYEKYPNSELLMQQIIDGFDRPENPAPAVNSVSERDLRE